MKGDATPWTATEFEARLRRVGTERYHDKHPFNLRMHAGTLTPDELRTWVRNRYYYQTRIPVKDAAILGKSGDSAFRREWVQRLHDHDGRAPGEGGLELWLQLAQAVGLARDEVASLEFVLPGVRRACARSAPSATTTSIPSTCGCTRASFRAPRSRPGCAIATTTRRAFR